MPPVSDPFEHHPELRDKIVDPEVSFYRTLTTDMVRGVMAQHGVSGAWLYSDDEREAMRRATMASHPQDDLWVFGYGSLMWDPGFRFQEVRRAHVPGHARRFILRDTEGGRGTKEAPGLMAALDTDPEGPGCDGLLFRIGAQEVDAESSILWQREIIGPSYLATFVTANTGTADNGTASAGDEAVTALTFLADHEADMIDAKISRDDQIEFIATGSGFLGSSLEYLSKVHHQFTILGITDPEVEYLVDATRAYLNERSA